MPPEEWAEQIYRLPNGQRFKWDYAPYSRRMFLSIFERQVISTSYQLFSRGLKSTVILLAIGYLIDQAPRRMLSLWPTNGQGEKYSKDILTGELFDTTPCLNFLGNKTGRRIGSNTLLHKAFPGGLIDIFGANAPGDMRRAKGSFLYADEIDAIDTTLTDEGDQLAIFSKRGDEYPDTIRLFAAYPSVKGQSRIQTKLDASDYERWYSTCVRCGGEPYVMHREMIVYDEEKPSEARMQCPRCKEYLTDAERYDMAHRQGFDCWKATQEFRGHRGFHANAMLWPHPVDLTKYPGGFLQLKAEEVIAANRSEDPRRSLRVIINTGDAEPFDPSSEDEKPPDWQPLYNRREDYTGIPDGVLVLTGAADLQLNRIEVEWKGWGRDERDWGIEHVIIDGDVRDRGTWGLLKRELQRKFYRSNGMPVEFSMFLIDGGFWADQVYAFLQELSRDPVEGVSGKVRASKGVGISPHPIISEWRAIAKNLKGYHVGTWQIKDRLNRRLALVQEEGQEPPFGWMRWNKSYSEQYFRQLCTAKATLDFEKGEEVRKFLNADRLRDEALDLNVYNYAAFARRQWPFEQIEREIREWKSENSQVRETPRLSVVRQGGGWSL